MLLQNHQFPSHTPTAAPHQQNTLHCCDVTWTTALHFVIFVLADYQRLNYVPTFRNTLSVPSSYEVCLPHTINMVLDSSVGIARQAADWTVRRSNPNGVSFSAPVQTGPGPTQPAVQCPPFVFQEGKATGTWRSPSTASGTEIKERVKLYFYSTSGPSRSVL